MGSMIENAAMGMTGAESVRPSLLGSQHPTASGCCAAHTRTPTPETTMMFYDPYSTRTLRAEFVVACLCLVAVALAWVLA